MQADIHTLYESGFYRILDFRCRCKDCGRSAPEYSDAFSISFVRKGNFLFNVFRHSLDAYTGCVLVTKPGYERTVTHMHAVPDECTVFEFRNDFYEKVVKQSEYAAFFRNKDLHSTLVRTNTETEFLHYFIMQLVQQHGKNKLQADRLVLNMAERILAAAADYKPDARVNIRLKRNHLVTIERAKEYISRNFIRDISLKEIADHCYVSPFHFSRIFKTFTSYAPHRFLLNMRLHHAERLLHDTRLPVGDVAYSSGFNSIEYFTAAFHKNYGAPPAAFRDCKQ